MPAIQNSKEQNSASDALKQFENFGLFQTVQFLLVCLPLCVLGMTITNYVFVAEDIGYRCRVSECENKRPLIETPDWWPDYVDTKCHKPVLDPEQFEESNATCRNTTFLPEWEKCTDWVYESNTSIVADFNLACQSWKATLVGSVRNSAMIISMTVAGLLSDKIGRKPAIIVCSIGGAIGVIKVFITNYYGYLVVEFLESFFSSGLLTAGVVLLIEIGGESKRVLTGVIFSYATYVGEFMFALLAMSLSHWKSLIFAINSPFILFISYGVLLRESTRWQMLVGKVAEVKDTFKMMARMNGIDITDKEIDEISEEDLKTKFSIEIKTERESVKDIVRSKVIILRLLVTSVCFFTSAFVYCGLMVHSVYLPGNKYMNFALAAVASFPGDLLALYTFNKYGRRVSLQCGYFATSMFVVAQAFTPNSPDYMKWVKLTLYLLGKFSAVVTFTGIYTYSLELFPTSVRGTLVGCGNTAARIGTMLAPLTPLLTSEMPALPSLLFAAAGGAAGGLLVLAPETRGRPMLDTIAQVEAYQTKESSRV